MSTAPRLISSEKRGEDADQSLCGGTDAKGEQVVFDADAWTGRSRRTGCGWIVAAYVFLGPPIGALMFFTGMSTAVAAEQGSWDVINLIYGAVYLTAGSTMLLAPWFVAAIPALVTGIAVASQSSNRQRSLVAAVLAPLTIYAAIWLAGDILGASLYLGDEDSKEALPMAIVLTGVLSSLACWFLTLRLQRSP